MTYIVPGPDHSLGCCCNGFQLETVLHEYYILIKYRIAEKFGGLVCDRQIKFHQYFILACIRMAIPYRTAEFKSANIF